MKEIMKRLKNMWIAIVAAFMLTGCPSGPDPDPVPEATPLTPTTISKTLQVDWKKGQQTYTLTDLKDRISNIGNTSAWLTVTLLTYSTGSPKVQLSYEENDGGERSVVVEITDTKGNKVLLTVKQQVKDSDPSPDPGSNDDQDTGIEDTHNTVTNQPAFIRGR